MSFRVLYTDTVQAQIAEHVAYLQRQRVSARRIDEWYSRLFAAIDSLYEWPLRFPVAERESSARGFEIRKLNFGDYLVFYRVDVERKTVEILSFTHGASRKET